mgnify:CR=1 FL=1
MITFKNVSKRYPDGYVALNNVDLEVAAGEMVFLTGHSGAGKSTLLKLIAAIERPTSGMIAINEQNIAQLKLSALPYLRRKIDTGEKRLIHTLRGVGYVMREPR